MADEQELQRFRQQWKEEVTSRARDSRGTGAPSSSAAAAAVARSSGAAASSAVDTSKPPSAPTSPRAQRTKRLSFTEHPPGPSYTSGPAIPEKDEFPSATTIPTSALEHYEAAVQKESQGSLGDSVKHYRAAFRLDEGVDKLYKEKWFPKPSAASLPTGTSPTDTTAGVPIPSVKPSPTVDLVASFSHLRIAAIPETSLEDDKKKFSLLASLPHELLLQTLRLVATADIASFARLAQVCKHLCHVVYTEERIWQNACTPVFARQCWDWKTTVSGAPLPVTLADEPEEPPRPEPAVDLALYAGSYREVFHLRPRIRFNGLYISTCNYHRPGNNTQQTLSWGTPILIVTYYRYLRFFPDGTCMSLLTTHEPAEVVYTFHRPPPHTPWHRYVVRGRWRFDGESVEVETEAAGMPQYLFKMEFSVGGVKGGGVVKGASKLEWKGFWSWNKLTDDMARFTGRNEKRFVFSRVKGMEVEEKEEEV